jgi:hypothetical protein
MNEEEVHERVRRFNEDEAVWRRFEEKRILRRLTKSWPPHIERILDELDWRAAKGQCRKARCVGPEVQ